MCICCLCVTINFPGLICYSVLNMCGMTTFDPLLNMPIYAPKESFCFHWSYNNTTRNPCSKT